MSLRRFAAGREQYERERAAVPLHEVEMDAGPVAGGITGAQHEARFGRRIGGSFSGHAGWRASWLRSIVRAAFVDEFWQNFLRNLNLGAHDLGSVAAEKSESHSVLRAMPLQGFWPLLFGEL